ncbi:MULTISPECIES: ATP-binding protein [unclassified Herbaspirillum]|uniref:ATP-binding protein n=1 Tax=unclassified Herbaspirillum TaxID=2624150 RepID=UPI000E2E7AF8|nr:MULTISPECIES: ATP-binding protein [unclassified Herbaspirillum]RFB73463.1 hypothetical protein DZB54_03955 [Herbaspirillum sp. 3R-3a1]TFI10730.1 hypothetical protein E4P32_04210 [Herbaspirillum sp. 3R11]TFI16637.1 hypothetical protein E4P31_04215 [Herbaspirillum sp. 3R-11]TFI31719.1 hypothetical protein E4P30_02050 [Herbaspirillum sp. 3C11]
MRLKKIKIRNFRCYRNEFILTFEDLTCLIAKNDTGKSAVLEALDAFFNLDKLESDDRSSGVRNVDPIEIACFFDDIPTALLIDTDALVSPRNEYLLNENGELEIIKSFSGATPKCEHIFVNAHHPGVANLDDLFGLSVAQLRQRLQELNIPLEGVNRTIKSAMRHAIWSSVQPNALGLDERRLQIKDTIWKPLQNALPLYQLFRADRPSSDQDAEAQDPIKFAIREALASREAELQQIGVYVQQQVEEVTRMTIEKLREMDPALAGQLNPIFSSFNWSKVFSVSLTGDNEIPLNKRGSGVRRLFLVNFFRAKAEQLAKGRGVSEVILAIEEPETSQHPNNQLLLLEALVELSQSLSNQVVFTTHNPLLARKVNRDQVRFIERVDEDNRVVADNDVAASTRLRDTLGILPNHNVRVFVGVEGPNDIEFLNRISAILSLTENDILNLENEEKSGRLIYIPMGGSTLELWTNRLEGLELPEVHIMDRDNQPPAAPKYEDAANRVNARAPLCIAFTTNMREMENLIHVDAINEEFNIVLAATQPFDDVPTLVAELVHSASSPNPWADLDEDKKKKKESQAKRRLNRGAVSNMSSARLDQSDPNDEVRIWLRSIGRHLG